MSQIIVSFDFVDPDLGLVKIYVRPNSKRISCAWKGQTLCLNVPKGLPTDYLQQFFNERIKPDALARKPQAVDTIDSELLHIDIGRSDAVEYSAVQADYIGTIDNKVTYKILVHPKVDLNALLVRQSIADITKTIMRQVVYVKVVAEAWDIACRLGLQSKISNIKATTAQTRYGSCSARGVISLSHLLATEPYARRVETITHELAHLTHMDHSEAFHTLHHQYLSQILPTPL